jgi:hypothetical protein
MADVVGIATVDSGGRTHTIDTGQKTAANSLPVVLASDTKRIEDCTVTDTGEIQGATSVTVCPTVTAKFVRFKARSDNAGSVYIGLSDATKADGTTDATTGMELAAGDDTGWMPATNLNTFYRICDNAGDDLTYMVLA